MHKLDPPVDDIEVDQETSMLGQGKNKGHDEFQVEVNRMRNSLNALTLKHFMFENMTRKDDEEVSMERKELVASEYPMEIKKIGSDTIVKKEVPVAPITIREQVVEKPIITRVHFEEKPKAKARISAEIVSKEYFPAVEKSQISSKISSHTTVRKDVTFIETKEQKEEKPIAPRVHFEEKTKLLFKEPSRESDEVANINNELPWQKKHQYRTVTPYFKPDTENNRAIEEVGLAFRPIDTSRSTEDLSLEILKPVPIFASKSYQELSKEVHFKPFDSFQTKSSDDLLFNNIDGLRKPESKRHKLLRIRSTSNSNLYENLNYGRAEVPLSADSFMRTKAPLPMPRSMDDLSESNNKRHSRTIVYVLDKERDEFVLEGPQMAENMFDEVYEDVLLRNNVTRDTDSTLFYSLVESREDCECKI